MERPIYIRDTDPLHQGSTLVVGIDKKGNITRFNDTLEQLTGSSKKEVLDVPFSTYFSKQIPAEELQKLVNQARFSPDSVDIDTSFQTAHGEKMVVSWTGFPIKNEEDGRVSQLNLVGTPLNDGNTAEEKKSNPKKKSTLSKKNPSSTNKDRKQKTSQKEQKEEKSTNDHPKKDIENSSNQKSDKIKSSKKEKTERKEKPKKTSKSSNRKKKETSNDHSAKKTKKKIKIKKRTKKSKTNKEKSSDKSTESTKEELDQSNNEISEESTKKTNLDIKNRFSTLLPKNKEKSKNRFLLTRLVKKENLSDGKKGLKKDKKKKETSNSLKDTIKKLKKENKKLKKENDKLEKKLSYAQFKRNEIKTFFNSKFRFIRDSVAIKKKREEFQQMMQQLSDRKQKLEQLEADMILEKKEFKHKIEEFITWREKLEKLEEEIEKRRQFLSEQEAFLNEQYDKVLTHELEQPASYTHQPEQENPESEKDEGILEKDDLFNSLTVEAAVLQRGRIKKANKRFAQMLGYSEDELVGKHLVDFVGPSGLPGVEQHYMNRLKGVDDASYHTVFLSKEENEIPVKVNVKTGDFQGERAEIATFNEV